MKQRLIFSLLLTGLCLSAFGQSIQWAVRPSYTNIRRMNEQVLLFRSDGQTGLMDSSGKELLPFRTDSITDFSMRRALLLSYNDGLFEITGILNEDDLSVVKPESKQKTYLGEYPFFSEGLLPVCNAKGQYGYMDESGIMVIDFRYSSAAPFSEGLALVGEGKNLLSSMKKLLSKSEPLAYINKKGVSLKLDRQLGEIFFGTSFFGERATVQTKEGTYYVIDQYGRIKDTRTGKVDLNLDDHLREMDAPARDRQLFNFDGPQAFQEGDYYGYRAVQNEIVPAQFFYAESFLDGSAIAATGRGAYGILRLVPGETQVVQRQGSAFDVGDNEEAVEYTVHLPEAYKQNEITLRAVPSTGQSIEVNNDSRGNGSRDFAMKLPLVERAVEVRSEDGVVLYRGRFPIAEAPADLVISVIPVSKRANEYDNFAFDVVFSNPGRLSVSIPISVVGKNVSCKENAVIVPAGEKIRVRGTCTKVTKAESRSITVTAGDITVKKTISVKPVVGN